MSRPNGTSMQQGGTSVRPPRQLVQPAPGQPAGVQSPSVQSAGVQSPGVQLGQYQGVPDPYGQQAYQNPQAPRPQGYPAQNDPYAGQQGYAQPGQYYNPPPAPSQPQTYAQQPDQSHFQSGTDVRNLQRGAQYDQWQSAPPAQDPRGYDLGGYATAPQAAPIQDMHARYQQASGPSLSHGAQGHEWVGQNSAASTYAQAGHEPTLDAQGYHPDQQYAPAGDGSDQQQEYAGEEGDYEYEEAPRGRGMKIAAALVGAIVIGGGLAYAYTTIIGPGSNGKPPIIKSASGPSKIKPAEPGGKQFAHTDSKIMGRLGDNTEPDASGAKKVTTLTVGPDGAIKPPAASEGAPAASDDVGFPATGTTLGSVKSDIAAPAAAAAAQAADQPVVVAPPAANKAVVVAEAAAVAAKTATAPVTTQSITQPVPVKPVAAAAPAKPAAVAAVAPPAVKKPAAPAAAVTAAAVAPPVTTTGAGFVAVLASVPASTTSRINALKQFADMQQKYGSVLQNKMPDVKEANLGEKGTYHRLLVGPPGSRDAANAVCGQLKTAGYTESCWVTAY